MCLIYRPKRRPAFTRLCYRYRGLRGQHMPGEWACGEYPKPDRKTARNGPGPARPRQTRSAPPCERCGRPAPRPPHCEDCYIAVQIEALPEDMMRALAAELGIDLGTGPGTNLRADLRADLGPETAGPADREEREIQPRLFTDPQN